MEGQPTLTVLSATQCSNDSDLVTLNEWTEDAPSIVIGFPGRKPTDPRNLSCYNGSNLSKWLSAEENTFAKWVAKPGKTLDESGRDGGPSNDPKERYWKLYTGEYVRVDLYVKAKIDSGRPYIFDAEVIGAERLGNLQGHFGESMLHGQAPGVTIYKLTNPRPARIMSNPEIDQLYNYSFDDIIQKVSFETVEKYPNAVINALRRTYLHFMYLKNAEKIVQNLKGNMDEKRLPNIFIANHNLVLTDKVESYNIAREELTFLPAIEDDETITFNIIGYLDGTWQALIARGKESKNPKFETVRLQEQNMVQFYNYLLKSWSVSYPKVLDITFPKIELDSLLESDDYMYGVVPDARVGTKYFRKEDIKYIFGVPATKIASEYFDEHGKDILDRLLQLYGRKPLEDKPPKAKKSKQASPAKVAKSPIRHRALPEYSINEMRAAYGMHYADVLLRLFPRSSSEYYQSYLAELLRLIEATPPPPLFASKLFTELNVVRASLVPQANYVREVELLETIRSILRDDDIRDEDQNDEDESDRSPAKSVAKVPHAFKAKAAKKVVKAAKSSSSNAQERRLSDALVDHNIDVVQIAINDVGRVRGFRMILNAVLNDLVAIRRGPSLLDANRREFYIDLRDIVNSSDHGGDEEAMELVHSIIENIVAILNTRSSSAKKVAKASAPLRRQSSSDSDSDSDSDDE